MEAEVYVLQKRSAACERELRAVQTAILEQQGGEFVHEMTPIVTRYFFGKIHDIEGFIRERLNDCEQKNPIMIKWRVRFFLAIFEAIRLYSFLIALCEDICRGSSVVEQRTENPRVGGSIPPRGTTRSVWYYYGFMCFV